LQRVAVCCSVLQCAAVCHSMFQCVSVCSSPVPLAPPPLMCARCSMLQCVAVCCSVLQCVAVCCSVLQCVPHLFLWHLFPWCQHPVEKHSCYLIYNCDIYVIMCVHVCGVSIHLKNIAPIWCMKIVGFFCKRAL